MSKATIHYCDIGDYLSREEKLSIIKKLGSILNPDMQWETLNPNLHNDWINLRNDSFGEFIPLAPEKRFDGKTKSFFVAISNGVSTARDNWVYNYSKDVLIDNIKRSIVFYNSQVDNYLSEVKANPNKEIEQIIDWDLKKFKWDRAQKENDLPKGKKYTFDNHSVVECFYRPFNKQIMYFNRNLNNCVYQVPKLFPTPKHENLVICIEGTGSSRDFGCLITNSIYDYGFAGVHSQCFPLYYYEETKQEKTLFDSLAEPESGYYARRDGISDFILTQARKIYGNKTTKEDIFYYVYALLHNPDYRTLYAADLKKMLPRLPLIDDSSDFWRYVKAGRELAALHLHYEDCEKPNGVLVMYNAGTTVNYEVTKMRFPANHKADRRDIIYNDQIIIQNIPAEAYEYVVNGKSAIEWIMERYQITTHKESGIVNDPNDWAREQGKPKYILDLLLSVITVSIKTVEIVKGLPKVEFEIR
jgi:predicted helicase